MGDVLEVIDAPARVIEVQQSTVVLLEVIEAGPAGPAGPPGAAGSGVVVAQPTPAGTWIIPHTFSRLPSVTVYDPGGQQVAPDLYATTTTVTVVFATPTAGTAVLI